MANRVDIIILGASGFTGKQVIHQIYKLAKTEGRSLSWGIAGRSERKLRDALAEIANILGVTLLDVPVIIADVLNMESLRRMARSAKVVINCCGPYHLCGEPVIKACIESGTHLIDASWEGKFIEDINVKYHYEAVEKGVYVVSACGFDSVPSDMGMVFLQNNFKGTLNSVEMYLKTNIGIFRPAKPIINDGTWKSLVSNFTQTNTVSLTTTHITQDIVYLPALKSKPLVHKSQVANSWAVPFFGPDRSVILKTQRFFHEHLKRRPIQYYPYLAVGSLINLIAVGFLAAIFVLFAKFEHGRKLLLRNPKIFTCGLIAKGGPSQETQNKIRFSFMLYGQGWKDKEAEDFSDYQAPLNSTVIAEIKGVNGYQFTGTALALSAIVVATETSKLPNRGGVYTPGAAFAETSFIEQLKVNGLSFEITSVS